MIYLNSLLPKPIKKIETAAELILAVALNDFAVKYLKEEVTCGSVRVNKDLQSQEVYAYAWDTAYHPSVLHFHADDKAPEKRAYNTKWCQYIMQVIDGLTLEYTPERWYFSFLLNLADNIHIRTGATPYNYVYLVAKWLIYRYMKKTETPCLVIDQDGYTLQTREYAALISLKKWGNKLFEDDNLLTLEYVDDDDTDSEWVAYFEEKRSRGMVGTGGVRYSAKEKIHYLTNVLKYNVGDIVLLYRRKASKNNGDITRNVIAVYPAVIMQIDNDNITLSYCTQIDTKLTRKHHLDLLKLNGANSIYTKQDYLRFEESYKSFSWHKVGVEGYSTDESFIIIPPIADDSTRQWLNDGQYDVEVELNTLETIYAVYEDRKLKYDKARFLARYFGDKVPVYEQYRQLREQRKQLAEQENAESAESSTKKGTAKRKTAMKKGS